MPSVRLAHLALLVAVCAAGQRVGAQDHGALAARVDTLARAAAVARQRVDAYDDSVRSARARTIPVVAGGVRVDAEAEVLALSRAAAPVADDSLRVLLGPAYALIEGHAFDVQSYRPAGWERRILGPEVAVTVMRPNGEIWRAWRADATVPGLTDALVSSALRSVLHRVDAGFFRWLSESVPRDSVTDLEWLTHRMALLSSRAPVGRWCYDGDLAACRQILALAPTADPVLQWHDSASRRRLVTTNAGTAGRISAAMTAACQSGSDSACVALLHQFSPALVAEPTSAAARLSLARHAVALGGTGAFQRLFQPAPDPAGHMTDVAAMPADALIARWRSRVRDARAPSRDLSGGIALITMAWVGGLGLLSLRSSRWR
jgi:hypothetical protein